MAFNSIEFLLFFAIVAAAYFALPHRARWPLLLVASYGFYMRWNPFYVVLIIASTAVDYTAGRLMGSSQAPRRRRWILLGSLTVNLSLLFTFKYWNFATSELSRAFAYLGLGASVPSLDLLLPVGISFYTFQTMSYTIDVYRGVLEPERHLGRFAVYVAYFPQLVAGPIERARRLLPQLREHQRFDWERITSGLQLALWGLFKKVVIADRVAIYVDAVYNNVGAHTGASHLLATYLFAVQIYCDFSGYSDIAIGISRVFGIDLMQNFRRPYFSTTIVEFWRRWHISLSTWLRDYLYIPLGGNRRGVNRTYWNLLITMVLGGLWHGASWNFLIWGALHGLLLSISRATLPARNKLFQRTGIPTWLRRATQVIVTFHLVCFCWIFFRANTLSDSLTVIRGIAGHFGRPFINTQALSHGLIGILVLALVQVIQERHGSVRALVAKQPLPLRWACWYFLIFSIILLGVDGGSQFIYFQF